jgi:hypothetical protein
MAEISQYADLLRETTFPSFNNLPKEDGVSLDFFETVDGVLYRPSRHWCFLGEIVDVKSFLSLVLRVKDKADRKITIAWYTAGRDVELGLSNVQKGSTVATLYPFQYGFLDQSVGIRQKELETAKVSEVFVLLTRDSEANQLS